MYIQPGLFIKSNLSTGAKTMQSAGYISVSEESYTDSRISFYFSTPKEKIALIPKYLSDYNYLYVEVGQDNMLYVSAKIKGEDKLYGAVDVSDNNADTNELIVLSQGTRFTVSYNNKIVLKFESALFVSGQVRIAGETGEIFYSCKIEEQHSISWTGKGYEVKAIEHEGKPYMKMKGSGTISSAISQPISLAAGKHTLSFSGEGAGKWSLVNGDQTIAKEGVVESSFDTRSSYLIELSAPFNGTFKFSTNQVLIVGEVQLENRSFYSGYIENESTEGPVARSNSKLVYPLKDKVDLESGSIYVKVSLPEGVNIGSTTGKQLIFKSGNEQIQLNYTNRSFVFTIRGVNLTVPATLSAAETVELIASWNGNRMTLHCNDSYHIGNTAPALTEDIDSLVFADTGSLQFPIILEEWALFPSALEKRVDIKSVIPQAVVHSLFEGGITGSNTSWTELPVAPVDHSPILVEKKNGQVMEKISFFDFDTGQYRTYNEETFIYDGESNYVEIAYADINEDYRDFGLYDEKGEVIGAPYSIEGRRLYFSLYDFQKSEVRGQKLVIRYQVNDSYTIDYNIKAVDGYRIDFAKHDGTDRVVYQEGNRYGEKVKLATMIDLNPIQNQNHTGFLYITQTFNKTDSFRVTVTPDRLPADGFSHSTLVIEPLDYQGNFLTHSNVTVRASKGFVCRHISQTAAEAQKRSGQYLYKYVAPFIQTKVQGEIMEDHIWITDLDSGIGICYTILLKPVKSSKMPVLTRTEKDILTQKTEIINAILTFEGTEIYEDPEIVSILDLNEDGRITVNDIASLESNKKDDDLTSILNQLREWEAMGHES